MVHPHEIKFPDGFLIIIIKTQTDESVRTGSNLFLFSILIHLNLHEIHGFCNRSALLRSSSSLGHGDSHRAELCKKRRRTKTIESNRAGCLNCFDNYMYMVVKTKTRTA